MNFEVDCYTSAWARIALCADPTWVVEAPDEFIVANQRLWAQHCRLSQILQDTTESQSLQTNPNEPSDKRLANQEHGTSNRRSVKDVIPESRLAQFYGNFYYDETRESCYINTSDRPEGRSYFGQGCENSDLTECWMLPEVEFWFRKLLDEPSERVMQRRRRQCRTLPEDDFERCGPNGARDEASLQERVRSVKTLWTQERSRPVSPPATRKMRARRRQPRRLTALAPPPPAYCLEAPAQLLCDPSCKFQFDTPRPQLTECQRAMGRLSASVQAVMRATAARCPPYRGTNITRYAPTGLRPRCPDHRLVWWPREHLSPRTNRPTLRSNEPQKSGSSETSPRPETSQNSSPQSCQQNTPPQTSHQNSSLQTSDQEAAQVKEDKEITVESKATESKESLQENSEKTDKNDKETDQTPEFTKPVDLGTRKKRLYSTVLSMSAPAPILPVGCVKLQKLTPGILKLNPKIVFPRLRPPNVDNKFEELEKEALEQYKASDESIDTKLQELEKQAVEQYSTSNSNTSCSSGNSAEKKTDSKKKSPKFHKGKSVDSVVIYSQNYADLDKDTEKTNLKNFHTPPRGEKKEHRSKNSKSAKNDSQKAASDTDEARENLKGAHKGPMRWSLHVIPKKRHLSLCVSDFSSDEETAGPSGSIKDAGPRIKNRVTGKAKMSAHGGGDLHPIMRKAGH